MFRCNLLDGCGALVSSHRMKMIALILAGLAALTGLGWLLGPWLLTGEGDMNDPRSEVHAAQLGNAIYVAGGIGFFRVLDSCARFDTFASAWSDCPDLPRSLHHVALAADETRVFASGGYSSLPFNIDQEGAVFALSLESGAGTEWQKIARLPRPLGQHTMSYHDRALYLVGGESNGETLDTLWRYDLTDGKWSKLRPLLSPRHSHAIAQDDEALYVTGGRSPAFGSQSADVERFDFATGNWSRLPDMPISLAGHGAAVIGGKLHVFGGENLADGMVHDRHDVLDLTTGQWSAGPALPEPRHGFAAAEVDGTIWVLGGGRKHGLWTPLTVSGTALPLSQN